MKPLKLGVGESGRGERTPSLEQGLPGVSLEAAPKGDLDEGGVGELERGGSPATTKLAGAILGFGEPERGEFSLPFGAGPPTATFDTALKGHVDDGGVEEALLLCLGLPEARPSPTRLATSSHVGPEKQPGCPSENILVCSPAPAGAGERSREAS